MDDRCPQQPGVPSDTPDEHGCPSDGDGDGTVDSADACPKERGPATADPATNGCPDAVRIVGTQIVISQTIAFATGKDDVAGVSEPVLSQIVRLLEDHPDIARVAVDGHTDDVGLEKDNLALSRRRAVAVVRWLVAHGVDERRLEARGFGPRRPLVPNDGEQGRARNRRVEFQILRRTPLGAAGWKDGDAAE
jgi:OOP family OmpA-OmpF porin